MPVEQDYSLQEPGADSLALATAWSQHTGKPILQAPVHVAFQQLCTAHPRLVMWGHVESGKTSQVSVMRVLWELGRNPDLRIVIVSRTSGQAQKITRTLQTYIESSEALHPLFYPDFIDDNNPFGVDYDLVTPKIAAKAILSFLKTGTPDFGRAARTYELEV